MVQERTLRGGLSRVQHTLSRDDIPHALNGDKTLRTAGVAPSDGFRRRCFRRPVPRGGRGLHSAGRHRRAVLAYRRALTIKGEDPECWFNLGFACALSGDQWLPRRHTPVPPSSRPANTRTGTTWGTRSSIWRAGRGDRGVSNGAHASRRDHEVWNNLGNALVQAERNQEARECFGRALALNPGYDLSWNNLGNVLEESGDLAEARKAFEMGYRSFPSRQPTG